MEIINEQRLTTDEAMKVLKISRRTLSHWSDEGLIRKITIPGKRKIYFDKQSIDKLLK
jgi:excisionase family DNA binding protein